MKTRIIVSIIGGVMPVIGAYATGATPETAIPTSLSYVTGGLNTKQAIMPAKDSDKIVTYGATAGAMGERAIITDPDDVVTGETGVMAVNATEGIIAAKQNKVLNIPSSNAVTSCGDECLSSRHIYANANGKRLGDGLIDAQTVNTAAVAAINSKFTQINENGIADSNGQLWRINVVSAPLMVSTTLDARINGTNSCYRRLHGNNDSTGNNLCGTGHEMSYIGNTGSKTGRWGVVFPYGDVSGISVCSNVPPSSVMKYDQSSDGETDYYNWGYIANGTESATLTSQYNSQAGNGTLQSDQKYCWCKMENPVASSWVFRISYDFSAYCAYYCADYCAYYVRAYAGFRGALFGAVQ